MEESYLEIWRRAGELDPAHASPIAWMVGIARSRAIDVARSPQQAGIEAEPETDDDEGPGAVPGTN